MNRRGDWTDRVGLAGARALPLRWTRRAASGSGVVGDRLIGGGKAAGPAIFIVHGSEIRQFLKLVERGLPAHGTNV